MTAIFSLPPIFTPPQSMTESAGWNRRLARLYGADTRVTLSIQGLASTSRSSILVVSPTRPNTL